jgi:hypothetical protein
VCKILHPLNTMQRMVLAVPSNAGLEKGFSTWVMDLNRMAKQIGVSLTIFADAETSRQIQLVLAKTPLNVEKTYRDVEDRSQFQSLTREITPDDLLVVVSARAATLSYDSYLDRVPRQLARDFEKISFVILYPEQKLVAG